MDEASLGLAPLIVDRVFDTLREIVATGVAVLLVEQYVDRALDLADTVYLMNQGRIVYSGAAAESDAATIFAHYLGTEADRPARTEQA